MADNGNSATEQPFAHIVFFTLKDDSAAAQQQLLQACHEYLTGHPGTVYYSVGTLADANRPVNDRAFHVALHLVFASRAAHDAYQDAERHHRFIAENRDNWAQVRIFDSDVQSST
jgi:quinol monooxygenase YgiN